MAEIRLMVSCHQMEEVPPLPLLRPIQVGAALSLERFPGFLQDDTGENISHKNRSYCELTAQYWAWKNLTADHYGFFHYRRYLYPDRRAKRPYRIERAAAPEVLERLGYGDFPELIPQYDLILPRGEDMHIPVWEHYAQAPHHHEKDLKLAVELLLDAHPEYRAAAETYLAGSNCYFGNIFIARRAVFFDYCSWLFPLLEEFDRRADLTGYGPQEQRVDGYLAERLLGIWVTAHRDLRQLELPRVHFIGDAKERRKKKIVNFLLPPGSLRRGVVKGWLSHGN